MIETKSYKLYSKLPVYCRRIKQANEIIKGILQCVENPFVAFSCGKDSSVLAHLVLNHNPTIPLRFLSSGETRLVHDVDKVLEYFRDKGTIIQELNIDRVFSEEWKNATWTEQRKAGNKDMEMLNTSEYDCIFMGLRSQESRPRSISLARHQDKGLPQYCYMYLTKKRENMIRCCPLANWKTEDIGAYIIKNGLPWLDWYDFRGFEGRTTARLTGDAVRQNTLLWLKYYKPDQYQILLQRFPEFTLYV